MAIVNRSSSARTIGNPTPTHHTHYHKITFLMRNVLNVSYPSSRPATTKVTGQLPFQKPLGLFPPKGAIPLFGSNPMIPSTGLSTQTLDLSSIGLSFPARATLQELEFGTVTVIEEEIFKVKGSSNSMSPILGKAKGIYVASSEDGSSHMIAMTVYFAGTDFKDGLRFFGVHQTDVAESHISIIGGIGKYNAANGYATIKAVGAGSHADRDAKVTNKLLLVNVYLS
ncbi:hypothetical protein F2P56_017073 [Juglans regia]|uniref:Dirigent protein n=2 Tax=Juglans regia TaxID=51240 RepID=A0A2I4HG80_JUGRE|nr:dirigent protein 18-like [Juglans regia]KAF5467225.1 hypothetical protein F2P56_017073 [Juglans regia]